METVHSKQSIKHQTYRDWFNEKYKFDGTWENKSLDVSRSNKCNFKSIICGWDRSSRWYQDEQVLNKIVPRLDVPIASGARVMPEVVTEKIISIKQYLKVQDINSIYDLLYIDNIDIKDIHQIRPFIKISYNDGVKIIDYQYNPFTNESNRSSIPTKAQPYTKIYNVNDITYDQLSYIPNFTPIDVVAVLKQQKKVNIKGTFQLKNSPGISYYGYKNLLSRV